MVSLMCFWAAYVVEAQDALQRNVIIILIDDLEWMARGCRGSSSYQTPPVD